MSGSYSDRLVVALRLRDVPGQRIGEVVAEVEAFAADSGQDPAEAFGPVESYSDDIAAQLRLPAPARGRDLLWSYPPAVGSLILVDGLGGTVRGENSELTAGEAVLTLLLPLAALLLVTAILHAHWWGYPAAVLVATAAFSLLLAGAGLVLLSYPAWIGLAAGSVLLFGGLALVTRAHRDPVIDPRTGRDRHPRTARIALLACAPIAATLVLLALTAIFG